MDVAAARAAKRAPLRLQRANFARNSSQRAAGARPRPRPSCFNTNYLILIDIIVLQTSTFMMPASSVDAGRHAYIRRTKCGQVLTTQPSQNFGLAML